MKPENWQQINGLFQAAVELEPSDRASFLDQECGGNIDLRLQIDSLLDIDSLDWEFFEKPAFESAAVLLAEEEPRLLPGQRVGHYTIAKLIGRGGMGEVYLARDEKLNRRVALKLLPADYTQNEYRLRLFRREAQTASAINHPNILTIYELGEFDGRQYIVSELVEGETLRERLSRGPLSVDDALDVGIQLAEALAPAHRAKIVHCDIKPENIMLRPDGLIKILDFGLARLADLTALNSGSDPETRIEDSSPLLMGTPGYMSPEHFRGEPLDARSDIFSLGIVFYEALSGCSPFDSKDRIKLTESVLNNDPPALDAMIPEQLRIVVAKMLFREKESRYQNAGELLADLRSVKKGLETQSKAKHRWTVISAIALICVLITGLVSYRFMRSITASSRTEFGAWTLKAPLSSPRMNVEPAVLNGVLYASGGWNGSCTPTAELEAYDPESDRWTQRAPMLTARATHGVAALDGLLYAVGGSTDCGNWIAGVEAYDAQTDRWSEKAPLPLARAGHVVAASNGQLYAIGGKSSETDYLDLNTRYDPRTDAWTEMAPMTTPRAGAAAAVVQGIIYVFGGNYKSRPLATVEAYDPMRNTWTARQPMPEPRNGLAVSEIGGIIYVFGGEGNQADVEAYDPVEDSWRVVAELPVRRYSAHAAALNGSVFITGGYDGVDYLSEVAAFTPEGSLKPGDTDCLTLHKSPKMPMPTARQGMAVGVIGGIAYVVGGYAGHWPRFVAANEAYDSITNSWTVKTPMPTARETRAANATVAGDRLFVIGGNAEGGRCTDLNQAYDPATDTWSTLAPMPTPRCHLALVEHDGLIYAIGGVNTSSTVRYSAVEVYNPATDSWSSGVPMPTVRQDARAVSLGGLIYVVGGWNPAISEDALDLVEAFDPLSATWINKAPMKTARTGMTAGVLNGKLIVAGGLSDEKFLTTAEIYDPVLDTWSPLNSMATIRAFSSSVTIKDTLYVFGGEQESSEQITEAESLTLSACRN